MTTFTAYIEFDEETKLYVGVVPGVPSADAQAASLDELRGNLQEVLELSLSKSTASCATSRRNSSECSRSRSPEWRGLPAL